MATQRDRWNDPQKYLKLPQGAFSGPSKDDIVNALALFFGSPSNPEKLADYTQARAVPPALSVLSPARGPGNPSRASTTAAAEPAYALQPLRAAESAASTRDHATQCHTQSTTIQTYVMPHVTRSSGGPTVAPLHFPAPLRC